MTKELADSLSHWRAMHDHARRVAQEATDSDGTVTVDGTPVGEDAATYPTGVPRRTSG